MAASGSKLVIVESPTKARTIRQYLGPEYRVEASMGHVRDLPARADEIPEEIKKKSWARIGVNLEDGSFEPVYVVPDDKKKVVAELRKAVRECTELFLATDEDREGESIGWHLLEVLKPKVPTRRMVFHEITPGAIREALAHSRELDTRLVQAQEARRILDRLVGYVVSPLLWKKVAPRLSAGRVQSVAVRMLVLRERERMAFHSASYWGLTAGFEHDNIRFSGELASLGGRRVATGRDFDETTGKLKRADDVLLLDETIARGLAARLPAAPFTVRSVDEKPATRSPYPPFTTSTLQQEANRKLGWGAKQTMQVAQKLYENGYITYMRTDSVNLSEEAVAAARHLIRARYGEPYLSPSPRRYATKAKGAQEAHEAIRPAGTEMRTVEQTGLGGFEARLYELIWKRTVATQMADARLNFVSAVIDAKDPASADVAEFRASGREVVFPGFFRAYVEGSDDPDEALDDQNRPLPKLTRGQGLPCRGVDAAGHETRPPARYTEATLVKSLEAEGIGRPSTYATILDTIQFRGYATARNKQLVPTFTAMAVTSLLEQTLASVVDIEFTAAMEGQLDEISDAPSAARYLDRFYSKELLPGLARGGDLEARSICTITSDAFGPYVVRVGKYGPYVELQRGPDEKPITVTLPDDIGPADLTRELIDAMVSGSARGPGGAEGGLGVDPVSGLRVLLMNGRFGPYVQLGESAEGGEKPRRTSLPKGVDATRLTLETALGLLSLPRTLGTHPSTGDLVKAGIGQYGPYVVHGKTYVSLRAGDDVLTVGLARALDLIAAREAGGGRARSAQAEPLRTIGAHPSTGEPIVVLQGRYGPYVQHGGVNATIPRETPPDTVTLEQAVALLAAREGAASTRTKRTRAASKGPASRPAATKAAAAKPATAKRAAPKKAAPTKAASDKAATAPKAAAKRKTTPKPKP